VIEAEAWRGVFVLQAGHDRRVRKSGNSDSNQTTDRVGLEGQQNEIPAAKVVIVLSCSSQSDPRLSFVGSWAGSRLSVP
jgi:hypothetical protein